MYDAAIFYDGYELLLPSIGQMKKIKLNFQQLKRTGTIQLARNVKTALTTNPNVPTPNPTPTVLGTKADAVEEAVNDHEAAKDEVNAKRAARDAALLELEAALRTEAQTVELACGGDLTKLSTTGFDLRDDPSPVGTPEQVQNLTVKASDNEGALKASWKKVRGANSYEIETSPDPITLTSWVRKDIVTKTRVEVNSFTSGQKIWVRVRAIGAEGDGPWSALAVKIVP
jgi:hypothetical protein